MLPVVLKSLSASEYLLPQSVLGYPIEEEDIPKLIGFLKRQEANGRYFSKAMQKEQIPETEEV